MMSSRRGIGVLIPVVLLSVLAPVAICSETPADDNGSDDPVARVAASLCQPLIIEGRPVERHSISERMQRFVVPAVSVAVIDDYQLVWAHAWGVIEAGSDQPVTTDTLFQAGSVSKPVAAVLAMALVSDGVLQLDRPVNRTLKSWKVPDNEYTRKTPVTLRHVLSHQAGFTPFAYEVPRDGTPVPGMAELLRGGIHDWPVVTVEFEPGSRHAYSNAGYCVLQLLLEEASGGSLQKLAASRVFGPLGMTRSHFDDPLPEQLLAGAACGHTRKSGPGLRIAVPVAGKTTIAPGATGGLWTTPSDLARLAIGLMQAWRGDSEQLVSQEIAREMLSVQAAEEGLGIHLQGTGPALKARHGGQIIGFITHLVLYPELGKGAVVMASSDGGRWLNQELIAAIASEYSWPDIPARRRIGTASREQLEPLAGTYSLDAAPEITFTARLEGETLVGRISRGESFGLTPTSEPDIFVLANESLEFVFRRDDSGKPTGVTLRRAGDTGHLYSRMTNQQ